MFMQNLSTAAERQSRNKSSKQKKKKGDEVTRDSPASSNASSSASSYASSSASSGLGADPLAMVALLKQSGKLYRQEDQAIPRDIVMGYLNDMVRRLATSANLEAIVAKHLAEGKPMFVLLVDYQQQVMEDEWRIEKQFGCQYLSALTQIYPSDTLIHNAASRFMFMCMRSYISAMKLLEPLQARPLLGHGFVRPAEGDSSSDSNSNSNSDSDRDKETVTEHAEGQYKHEPLPKSNFMEFMECCNAMNAMPETKKKLKAYFEEHQAPPAPALEEIRRQVWEMCGVDPEYGDYELTQAPKHYAGMQSVALKINQFYLGQDLAAKEAMMSELEKKAFYDQIPVVMHHMPHLFMFQRMMQQQQQQNHVHGPNCQHNHDHGHGHGHDHGHDHGHSHGHDHHQQQQQQPQMNPQQMQEFQAMMATEDGKAKVASFSSRMESMRSTAAQQVDGWSSQQRQAFFDKFADTELVAKMNSSATANPMEKLQSFMSMTDEDLESLMVLQTIVQADRSSNSLDVSKLQNKVGDMSVSGSHGHGHGHDHSHSHSHGHDHVHGEQCQHGHDHSHGHGHGHGHGHSSAPVPDVASGKSASMDR